MRPRQQSFLAPLALLSALADIANTFPPYGSLGGLSDHELKNAVRALDPTIPGTPPGPLKNNGTKLVNDLLHPYHPPGPWDIRGPCPGLNTLANHGVCRPLGSLHS